MMLNKKVLAIFVLSIMLLSILPSFSSVHQALANSSEPVLTDDAYVDFDHPTTNYGSSGDLLVKWWTGYGRTRTLLKFDLAGQTTGHWELALYVDNYGTTSRNATLHPVYSDTWTEEWVTWNIQPTFWGAVDSRKFVSNDYELLFSSTALDDFINSQIEGDGIVSFMIRGDEVSASSNYEWFSSKEYGDRPPRLYKPNLNPKYHVIEDTYFWSSYPIGNYGSDYGTRVGGGTSERRTLLKFNLTGAVAGSWRLYIYGGVGYSEIEPQYADLWSVESNSWAEGTVTWNTQPDHITNLDASLFSWTASWVYFESSALTNFVNLGITGSKIVSFELLPNANWSQYGYAGCVSKELSVTYSAYLIEVINPTTPFGQGSWNPHFSGFYYDGNNLFNKTDKVLIEANPTVRVNYPFQHCLLIGANDVSMAFYEKQWNGTHWVLGYKWSKDNLTWSSFVPLLYVQTDDLHRSKYDVCSYSVSSSEPDPSGSRFHGYFLVALGKYSAGKDVAGSSELYFFMGNITDWNSNTISWDYTLVSNDTDYYFYDPVIDSCLDPVFGYPYYGLILTMTYNATGSYIYSFRSSDTDIHHSWVRQYLGEKAGTFAYYSGLVFASPALTYFNNVTNPQYNYFDADDSLTWTGFQDITTTPSTGMDFSSLYVLIPYGWTSHIDYHLADFAIFLFKRSSDDTLWLKWQNITAYFIPTSDGGWVNETLVTSMTGVQNPQITDWWDVPTDNYWENWILFLYAKGDVIYLKTLTNYIDHASNKWTFASQEKSIYGGVDLDESSLHSNPDFPQVLFIQSNALYVLTLGIQITSKTPVIPPPPPIFVGNAYAMTWYFRSDTHTVHDQLGYKLDTTNTRSEVIDERTSPSVETVSYGVRIYVVNSLGYQYELTSGNPEAIMTLDTPYSGMKTASWLCPSYGNLIDSIMIEVYQRFGSDPWSLRRIFISNPNLLIKLPRSTWNFTLWVSMTHASTHSEFGFGDYDVYNSRVVFQYYRASPWEVAFSRLYQHDFLGFLFTPWTYFLGDLFWTILLFAVCVSFYLRFNSWKPILAMLWIFGGAGSILWALIPAISLHVAVVMLALAMAVTLYKILR